MRQSPFCGNLSREAGIRPFTLRAQSSVPGTKPWMLRARIGDRKSAMRGHPAARLEIVGGNVFKQLLWGTENPSLLTGYFIRRARQNDAKL